MRAVWYDHTGPAREVLRLGEVETPTPGPDELRVQLHASGVNPADMGRRSGASIQGESFPFVIPHSDGAGIVDAVGAGVPDSWIGRRVWLYNGQRQGRHLGTAAEAICLDHRLVTELPDDVSFDEGACLGIPAMTAHACLFAGGPVQGLHVLVTGGAGAVGHYAVQLARWGGAERVIATVSSAEKAAVAIEAGADAAIDYRRENVAERVAEITGGRGVDRIVEVDLGGNIADLPRLIADNGLVAYYATSGNAAPILPAREMMRKCVTLRALVLNALPAVTRDRIRFELSAWLNQGQGRGDRLHRIAGRFPLAETAAAHELVESGSKAGTVIVRPRD